MDPSGGAATGRICVRGIRVWARHGVLPEEQRRGQPFLVDVTVELDLAAAAASDDLDDTVDYGRLASRVAEVAAGGPFRLLETVAGRVLDAVLADGRVRAAEVTVHKPRAPLDVPADDVAVTLRRARAGGG